MESVILDILNYFDTICFYVYFQLLFMTLICFFKFVDKSKAPK